MHRIGSACLIFLLPVLVQAQVSAVPAGPSALSRQADGKTAVPGQHALVASDLESFFDGIVPLQLERSDVAGASVMVMQDGQVLLRKGYGYADLKHKKPVDPAATVFRLASISKLFTWVSVMQLVEQGRLDLDTDVNRYLDFQIRPAFSQPVTLRNLMTHTGGFEEVIRDIIVTDPKQAVTLRDYLIRNQPQRLFPPGAIPAYSNYGVGIAGYIVQRVSGQPFEQYVEQHIFTPLKMEHSTFYQPPPTLLRRLPSEGYPTDTEKPPIGFEIFNPVSAGGVSSTADDMGRFGQALLNGGELDGNRILKPETLEAMWTPQFRSNGQMPPLCMGFYETWRNGLRWIGHEGDLVAFHSLFMLEPQNKLTLFVSYNSTGSEDKSRPEIIDMFTDRYFPGRAKQSFVSLPRNELTAIEGVYRSTRREDSTWLKLLSLFQQRVARVDKMGVLHLSNAKDLRDHPIMWKPIGRDLWQEMDGQQRVFAIRDQTNRIVRLAYDFPGVQSQRVPWYERKRPVLTVLVGALLVLLAVILAPVVRQARRMFLGHRPMPSPQPGTRWLPATTQVAALVWVILFALLGAGVIALGGDDAMPPTSAWDKYFVLMNFVTVFALGLSLFVILSAVRTWGRVQLRRITRVKYAVVAIACMYFSWFSLHWHLLGPVRF
ncbi:MAG: serine hydrolase domain-containing protein [Acidobacteriaceae bacterium]